MFEAPKPPQKNFFKTACLFEASLLLVAYILGWLTGLDPLVTLNFSESALLYGIIGTLPLIFLFLSMEHAEHASIRTIRQLLMDTLASRLLPLHWSELLILGIVAGLSEEALFRGFLQIWLTNQWGYVAGLILSNLLFGLAHAITPLYAVLATLVGIYLGLSMNYSGSTNLLTPVIIHGLYDFLAFLLIIQKYRRQMAGKVVNSE